MKRQPRILAGTALGLLMASAPLGAFPLQGSTAFNPLQRATAPLVLVQSNCAEGESAEACAQQAEPERKPRKKREQQQQTESAPAEQQAEPEQKPRKKRQQQQTESAPAEQQAEPEQKPRKKRQQQQTESAPAEQQAEPEQKPRKKRQQQQTESAPAEQVAPAESEPRPRKKKRDQQREQIEAAPSEQAAPANDEQQLKPRRKKRDQQQQIEAAPAEQAAPASDEEQPTPRRKKRDRQQQEAAPSEQPAEQAEPRPTPADRQAAPAEGEQPLDQARKRRKPAEEQPATGEQPSTGEQPAEGEQAAPAEGEGPVQGEASADPNAAPVFDSQKDAVRKRKGGRDRAQETGRQDAGDQEGSQPGQQDGEQAEAPRPAPVDQGPPPTDDRAAQQEIRPGTIAPVTQEKGTRVERAPDFEDVRRRPRPEGANIVREFGDRVILQFNNQTIVESNDAPRLHRGAREVYYEELPGDRTREIVERENGIQIVTIRNRYGNVIQRSRIAPDGREYVLSYVDERYYEDVDDWRDPGDDLPPIRLDIPREEYILDAEDIEDPDDYYTFLEQPPVERVQRLYSIDEVKRSARVRDIARRVDLDTLNFEFGSASIPDSEVQKLEGVATAMERLLEKNPAETFLIEGHTDAVGRPEANLALSDRRAEAVAEALTNAFSIPPENLTTQGYGEEYLKVNTSEPERENRRVAIRRITSLVAPVASAE
ncbi:OmpA family protein [Mesorhizobium tianshanense]|uniref:Outer membrane protein OmpA-like peptidoglycan-associated protein n=1 Tax=Mesorhizobium tianshanense TaxID=39844 RepID=A0A562NZG2_9HYPH|nr:OmpA family protein [Mesorhizobium tianshanense]TWI37632.1 outer membrane protein OmpA-like peptidoglycan-associated protein [Mesorhizobium tianshanense]